MEKIRVVSIDDHHLIHEAIRSLLDDEENIHLVADGYAGEDVLRLVENYKPHILILDLMMPQVKDDELDSERFLPLPMLERLHQEFPAMGIIILSQYLHHEIAQVAIQNGVRGYLLKSDNLSLYLATAITQPRSSRFGSSNTCNWVGAKPRTSDFSRNTRSTASASLSPAWTNPPGMSHRPG